MLQAIKRHFFGSANTEYSRLIIRYCTLTVEFDINSRNVFEEMCRNIFCEFDWHHLRKALPGVLG